MDKSYRINTNISNDTILNVNMKQDYDFLEVLTMKLRQKDAYRLHSSNYGVVIGRVLANDAFGIPNAKVSLFIERDDNDNETIESIYPYKEVMSKDDEGRRYNLLPDDSDDDCYRVVGTFPNKRLVLDNDSQLEIFDRYWKYTTVTNNAGDYMLFGIPSGSQQIHVDIDLSDIGVLSQKPRDFLYKGYNLSMFDSTSQFKESTNLDSLAQLFSQNKSTFVYPFWGDTDNGIAAITRCDVQIQYKFEPTCVFMGAIVSDNDGNAIGPKCAPEIDNGMNNQLVAGEGTIEMIRKTTDGLVEEFQIQGNQLIDSDGVWCYQIPMNLDFVGTDEYGNIVPTDNPNKGIPTRTQVRFRFSKIETGDEGFSRHTAKYLVPMNPIFDPNSTVPSSSISGQEFEKFYTFGSATPDSCFRDLYWNNVYSVKNYVPKVQVAHRPYSKNYGALKGSNLVDNQNSVPFNHLRIDMPFMYVIVCIIFQIVMLVVSFINAFIIVPINFIISILNSILNICLPFGIGCLFDWAEIGYLGCVPLGGDISGKNVAYYPGCDSRGKDASDCPEEMDGCSKSSNNGDLEDLVQQRLAEDYDIVKLDFYQDWLNGTLYMPLWYWMKRKKKTFLFGLFSKSARNDYCSCDKTYSRLKTFVTCNIDYTDENFGVNGSNLDLGEEKWHRSFERAANVRYARGLIKGVVNKNGLTTYYYVAMQATDGNASPTLPMSEQPIKFKAVLLYATDIILLGNLNENNIYGIPQFFKALPSTTANIPPIAPIEEDTSDQGITNQGSDAYSAEDAGISLTTGMDWGHDGGEDTPTYKYGLFMDLECTNAKTRSKSCINVERLSELGVNLDMSHIKQYATSNGLQNGFMDTDGFITKYELDDMENRAMFATMNHIGFIPQTYQDSIGGYTTQVEDERTHYLVPKFKYIYPVDFDGRMKPIMDAYKNGFQQSTYDVKDQAYITFRMGAEANNGEFGRGRHFYHNYNMPVYNNSFYFYFGINKGKTAIDKFNKLFYAECVNNSKMPFTLDIESKGRSYCPSAYELESNGYAYIKVSSDDIQIPYSYVLYDSLGNLVNSKYKLSSKEFIIEDVETTSTVDTDKKLKNQVYSLIVTDGNGKSIRERVSLDMDFLSFEYEVRKLGTKFYTPQMTPKSFICDEDDDYFGIIKITKANIDGYSFTITNAELLGDIGDNITIKTTCKYSAQDSPFKSDGVVVYFKVNPIEDNAPMSECLCDGSSTSISAFSFVDNTIELYIYRPMSYSITMTQECDGQEIEDNKTSQLVKVDNGSNFNTFLNGMPIRFMLGTINDTPPNTNKFYSSSASDRVVGDNGINQDLIGWFGVHQETSYMFDYEPNKTKSENEKVWTDYLSFGNNITTISSRSEILKYKFENMFKLSNVVYNTSTSDQSFNYTYLGGVEPILSRTLAPYYGDTKKMATINLYKDSGSVSMSNKYPNIVGSNYIGDKDTRRYNNSPRFNGLWGVESDGTYLGNYFAAFTNNGRYTSSISGKCTISIMAIPNYAPVNAVDGWKKLGRDMQIDNFPMSIRSSGNYDCGKKSQPYLRALTVDRRLDYDLEIWSPTSGDNFRLNKEEKYERIWKSSRIRGIVYGGIEMSYDEYDNILSADTDYSDSSETIITSITPNNRLEYSYSVDTNPNSNAITIYNMPKPNEITWVDRGDALSTYIRESGGTLYEELYNNGGQNLKTFYEADCNGMDIRQLFWSTFNEPLLKKYCTSELNNISATTNAVFIYSGSSETDYNGDFNTTAINANPSNNYPTKRYIDIGNLPQSSYYSISLASCGYSMKPQLNEDGSITSTIRRGDRVELEFNFGNPFEFINPENAVEGNIYPNINMIQGATDNNGYTAFKTDSVNLDFKYRTTSNDGNIHSSAPTLISVLKDDENYCGGVDAITYLKTASNYVFGTEPDYYKRLNETVLGGFSFDYSSFNLFFPYFRFLSPNIDCGDYDDLKCFWLQVNFINFFYNVGQDVFGHDDIVYLKDDNYFYKNNDKGEAVPILDGSEELNKLTFRRHGISLNGTYVFALAIDRRLEEKNTTLTKKVVTHETSSLFDARDIIVKMSGSGETSTSQDGETTVTTYTHHLSFTFKNNASYYEATFSSSSETITCNVRTLEDIKDFESTYPSWTCTNYSLKNDISPKNYGNQAIIDNTMTYISFQFLDANNNVFETNGEDVIDGNIDYRKPHSTYIAERNVKAEFTSEAALVGVKIYPRMFSNFAYGINRTSNGEGGYNFIEVEDYKIKPL